MNTNLRPILIIIATAAVLAALILSGLSFYAMLQIRDTMLTLVDDTRVLLADLPTQTITTTVRLNHTFPIAAEVPFNEEFSIPLETVIPIDTTVQVPLEIPLFGTYELSVPVEAQVPVSLEILIPIEQTVSIDTELTLDTEVPVEVELGQIGLIEQLDETLANLADQLRQSPLPFLSTGQTDQ